MKRTNEDLIKTLAREAAPFQTRDELKIFLTKWFLLSTLFLGICLLWMPWRGTVYSQLSDPYFELVNFLWLSLSVSSAIAFYKSCFPQKLSKIVTTTPFVILSLLFLMSLPGAQKESLLPEFDIVKGGCGIIIMIYALIQGSVMFAWAQKGAPRKPKTTGVWTALSSGASGCLLMQVVCLEENCLHALVWHFVPLFFLVLLGQFFAKHSLRW